MLFYFQHGPDGNTAQYSADMFSGPLHHPHGRSVCAPPPGIWPIAWLALDLPLSENSPPRTDSMATMISSSNFCNGLKKSLMREQSKHKAAICVITQFWDSKIISEFIQAIVSSISHIFKFYW